MGKRLFIIFAITLFISLSFSACDPPRILSDSNSPPVEEIMPPIDEIMPADVTPTAEYYWLHTSLDEGGVTYVFDREGNRYLYDDAPKILSGKGKNYIIRTRFVRLDSDESKKQGYDFVYETALFSASDELIFDYGFFRYSPAFGDFVIRSENNGFMYEYDKSQNYVLVNTVTGEVVFEDIIGCTQFGENILLTSGGGRAFVIVNYDGEVVAHPVQEYFRVASLPTGKFVVAEVGENKHRYHAVSPDLVILNDNPDIVGEQYCIYGEYIYCGNEIEMYIVTIDNERVFTAPIGAYINYFDGRFAITMTSVDDQNNNYNYTVFYDGKPLFMDCQFAEAFDGQVICNQDGVIYHINKNGEVIGIRDGLPNFRVNELIEGLYLISDEHTTQQAYLVDSELNDIMSGQYRYFRYLHNGDNKRAPLFIADRIDSPLCDIYDKTGRLIVKGVTTVGTGGRDVFAVRKGTDYGMMDYNGNFIKRYSIYDELID